MDKIERLLAVEEIKQLKSKYFYCFDHKDWAARKSEVWAQPAPGYTRLHGFGHTMRPMSVWQNGVAY